MNVLRRALLLPSIRVVPGDVAEVKVAACGALAMTNSRLFSQSTRDDDQPGPSPASGNNANPSPNSPASDRQSIPGWLRGPEGKRLSVLEEEWVEIIDSSSGQKCWKSIKTGQVTVPGIPRPDTWTEVVDKQSGLIYYWNRRTGDTTALGEAKPGPYGRRASQAPNQEEELSFEVGKPGGRSRAAQDGSSSGSGVEGGRDKQGNGAGGGSSTSSTSGSSSATSSCHVGGSTKGAPPPLLLPTSSARGILKPPGGIVSPTNRQPPAWSGFAASVPLDIKTPGRVTRSTALSSPQAEPQGCSPPSQPPQPPGFSLPSGVELPPGSSGFQRPASKLYRLHRVPPVLLLHLKRFQHNGRGRLSKICTAVQFDHQLDLAPYLPETSAVQPVTCLKYDLVGVVEHSGTMKSGHYVAYVKRAAGGGEGAMANGAADVAHAEQYSWHYVSDAAVRPATEEQVSKAQAYLLMYVRRGA
mmetsp:Transcript_19928/g.43388  ORF Transcript_19928/g.43388 Transcript_19928/m.43388 type:complete len:469 (+) Transcript_19928:35-1441(+)